MLYKTSQQNGNVLIIVMVLFVIVSLSISLGLVVPVLHANRNAQNTLVSKESYVSAESSLEDILYRLKTGKEYNTPESLSLNGGTVSTAVTTTAVGKEVTAIATVTNDVRKVKANVAVGSGVSFHYGVQAGRGGFQLLNSSTITGNVHSSGPIIGSGGNIIGGDAISAGATGILDGIHATGSAYAHTIQDTQVDKNAFYTVLTNTTVAGTKYPNSTDQDTADLPIPDSQIEEWESYAAAGGTMSTSECDSYSSSTNTCTLSASKTIGPKKIPFNLLIKSSSAVITVAGHLWVTGTITTQTGPTIRVDPALGSQNIAIIADDPTNRSTGSTINVGQSTAFQNSGVAGSFVFMISQNNSAENGGSNVAFSMNQGASALVAYASHGLVTLSQSVSLKEVTAYKIILQNTANVTYDTGLPSVLFQAGPSGGYEVIDWDEIQ